MNMKIVGDGHMENKPAISKKPKENLPAILLPGIGDIIYTWYKLINYVEMGHNIDIKVLNCNPQRSHQIMHCLEGMGSFEYIPGFEYDHYWLKQVEDLRKPPVDCLCRGIPVLNVNSFLESNQSLENFMPDFPAKYDIELITKQEHKQTAEEKINKDQTNIILYSSSYRNNINCRNHPYPHFWVDVAQLVYDWRGFTKPLKIYVIGASYDLDLTHDVHKLCGEKNIEAELLIDNSFPMLIEMIRRSDFVIGYESGFGMIADCLNIPQLHMIRYQGGIRDDKRFPYLGPINPDDIGKTYWPCFYDEEYGDIKQKLEESKNAI